MARASRGTTPPLWALLLCLLSLANDGADAAADDAAAAAVAVKRVGVVVAPGFEDLDALGPYEIFKAAEKRSFSHNWETPAPGISCAGGALLVTVTYATNYGCSDDTAAPRPKVTSLNGAVVTPAFDLDTDPDATHFDLLVLPGGAGTEATVAYVGRHHARGGLVMSVSTGASVVAPLGLLDGRRATTDPGYLGWFRSTYPAVQWVDLADADPNREARFVAATPQVTTCASIAAGIDGALHQVKRWCGADMAEASKASLDWSLHTAMAFEGYNEQFLHPEYTE